MLMRSEEIKEENEKNEWQMEILFSTDKIGWMQLKLSKT